MYKVTKPAYYANVTVVNTETNASVTIGRLNTTILDILTSSIGYELDTAAGWNFEVNKDTAMKLTTLAMRMKKPIRTKAVKEEVKEEVKSKRSQPVDVFNLIFGIDNN